METVDISYFKTREKFCNVKGYSAPNSPPPLPPFTRPRERNVREPICCGRSEGVRPCGTSRDCDKSDTLPPPLPPFPHPMRADMGGWGGEDGGGGEGKGVKIVTIRQGLIFKMAHPRRRLWPMSSTLRLSLRDSAASRRLKWPVNHAM